MFGRAADWVFPVARAVGQANKILDAQAEPCREKKRAVQIADGVSITAVVTTRA